MDKFIPLSIPNFEGNEREYVDDAIDQGWVSTGGAYITKLEENMAEFLNVDNVAACQSGTSAIHMSLVEIGIEPGDVVIVPTLTFIAAVNHVRYQFASPVFMDCDDSLCMDPIKLQTFCEEECDWDGNFLRYNQSVVKAIIAVHVFGNMADMEAIIPIARKYNMKVIEDATEALGTKYSDGIYKGKYAGTIGDFGCYSFNGNKIITTGGGGALTSTDTKAVDHLRFLSTQAKTDPYYYIHNEVGYNYRMTNVQAALGVAQLEELPGFIMRKNDNYELYKSEFEGFEYAKLMTFRSNTFSNKWFYSLIINREYIKNDMREIIASLDKKGIQVRPIWGLISNQLPYKEYESYKLEKASYYAERVLNIPCSTQIKNEEIKNVSFEIKQLLKELANE